MYSTGDIIYFNNFDFGDGTSKPKYAIVYIHNGEFLLLSLTTSQDKYLNPEQIPKETGAIRRAIDKVFYFAQGEVVCESGFSFPIDTYVLFRQNFRQFDYESFEKKYGKSDVELMGRLTKKILIDFTYTALTSKHLPKKHILCFDSLLEDLYK